MTATLTHVDVRPGDVWELRERWSAQASWLLVSSATPTHVEGLRCTGSGHLTDPLTVDTHALADLTGPERTFTRVSRGDLDAALCVHVLAALPSPGQAARLRDRMTAPQQRHEAQEAYLQGLHDQTAQHLEQVRARLRSAPTTRFLKGAPPLATNTRPGGRWPVPGERWWLETTEQSFAVLHTHRQWVYTCPAAPDGTLLTAQRRLIFTPAPFLRGHPALHPAGTVNVQQAAVQVAADLIGLRLSTDPPERQFARAEMLHTDARALLTLSRARAAHGRLLSSLLEQTP